MKRAAVLLLLLVVPLAGAAPTASFRVEMTDDGFLVDAEPGLDPVLFVEPGTHVHVAVHNNGTRPENFHVGAPVERSTPFAQRPGESATLDFDVPPDLVGDIPYYSDGDASKLASVFRVGARLPIVRFVDPATDGATVTANATLRVSVDHFTLDPYPFSTVDQAGRGHVRYLVDGKNASGLTNRTSVALQLAAGTHLVRALLVQHDGTPVDPLTYADRVVRVVPGPTPAPARANVTDVAATPDAPSRTPGPSAAWALALALGVAIASRSRRPR